MTVEERHRFEAVKQPVWDKAKKNIHARSSG